MLEYLEAKYYESIGDDINKNNRKKYALEAIEKCNSIERRRYPEEEGGENNFQHGGMYEDLEKKINSI